MSQKVAAALVVAGLVTREQLAQALHAQVLYGGSLCANLLALEILDEEALVRFFRERLGYGQAPQAVFEEIDPRVVALVPFDLAVEFHVVPFHVDEDNLELAMEDPTDERAISEVGFFTGYPVRPYCAKISDLADALKRYYHVTWILSAIPKEREPTVVVDWDHLATGGAPSPRRPVGRLPLQEDEVVEEVVEALRAQGRPPPSPRARPTLTWTLGRLEHAVDRAEIGELCTAHAAGLCSRAALFILRSQTIVGWLGAGELTRRQVQSALLPLNQPSLFHSVLEKRAAYVGSVPRDQLNALFLAYLGGYVPAEVVLQPLVAQGQIFCILYGDRRSARFGAAELQELELVADAAARAFERLLERLLAVGDAA
jgi:type IV pilus assembly protein PilB